MGLRDYYRQFEDVDEEALNAEKRERRHRERKLALEKVPDIDLSTTEWPEFPNSEVVNASIYTARGRVNGYPDRHAASVRRALGIQHGVPPERIAVGNGAAELLQSLALTLLDRGDELLTPWPSYPLYPLMAARAGGRPVTAATFDRLPGMLSDRTRLVVVCNPNDPTGEYVPAARLAELARGLPEEAWLVIDEALVHFQDAEPVNTVLALTNELPRLVVVRTFSKIYGLSGLRAGYAVASDESAGVLDAIAPVLGVNSLTQAAIEQALEIGGPDIEHRRAQVIRERGRLLEALRELPYEVSPTQANFLWLAHRDGRSGSVLSASLAAEGVLVADGAPLGEDHHVRVTIRDAPATQRLIRALQLAAE